MIDTIVIRIHNIQKYGATIANLFRDSQEAKTKFSTDYNTGEIFNVNRINKMVYHDSLRDIPLSHRNSCFIPSSHYSLAYDIDFTKGFIEFNFAIPKFKYGTNLIQFVDYYDQSCAKMYQILKDFINDFLKQSFFVEKISLYDIEINRIDLCFNQFFPTASQAVDYLNLQAKKMRSFTKRQEERGVLRGEESITIQTDRWTFKIYHKGPEFEKNDYKELVKNRNPKGYDLEKFKELAWRILRYEITYRNSYFNYLFRQWYYEDSRVKKKSVYRYLFKVIRIDGDKVKSLVMKKFTIKSDYDNWKKYKEESIKWYERYRGDDFVTFDYQIFSSLYEFFWLWVKKFQVSGSVSTAEFERRLNMLNDAVDTRNMLRTNKEYRRNVKRLMMYARLTVDKPLMDLVKIGQLSRSQYYKLKKDFEKVGLSDFNPDLRIVKPSIEYQDYKMYFGNFH